MPGNIKGITIELDGNSTKLTKAIDGVKRESISLQSELKEVDKLLKFNPGNADLIAQKQQNLAKQIDATSQKLNVLKQAQTQVEAQFRAGTLSEEKYRAFQRELISTESALRSAEDQMVNFQAAQIDLAKKTQQLQVLFNATGTSVNDFSDVLGNRLTNAISNGTASAKQIDQAIKLIGQSAIGADVDIDRLRTSLQQISNGGSIGQVSNDIQQMRNELNPIPSVVDNVRTSLQDVEQASSGLKTELQQVQNALRLDPNNITLVTQQQDLLSQSIQQTEQKLNGLKQAQQQVEAAFESGNLGVEEYRQFQRELGSTEAQLSSLNSALQRSQTEQQAVASSTQQLNKFFEATGKNVHEFAGVIGPNLAQAIAQGRANSQQLEQALTRIGREALGASADLDQMRSALRQASNGGSLNQLRSELQDIERQAGETEEAIEGIGDSVKSVIAGLAVGGGIAGVVDKALDTSSLKTKIDITFDVPEESKQSVYDAIKNIEAYGVDAEAALQGVQRQWALNKNASDEANTSIIKQAGVIATAFAGIDFNELIQESYEIGKSMGISQEGALALTNALLKMGFPAEQLDIISEYGTQLKNAGYNAQEIQSIIAAGVETGTWNIDNLLDGLKEGRIKLAEFGQGIPKSMSSLLKGTDISSKQLQKWGQDVAKGGKTGSQAMTEVAKALVGVKDETQRNALGVALFGTMYEDQGKNITDTLINASQKTSDLKKDQDDLNNSVKQNDASPMVKLNNAITDMQKALAPLLTGIAEIVAKIADWISNNSTLAAVIAAVVTAIGLIVAGFMALAPIFTVISTLMAGLGVAFSAIAAPIAIAIAAIVALVAAGVALWKNWDTVSAFLKTCWEGIKTAAQVIWDGIKLYFTTMLSVYKTLFTTVWNGIKTLLSSIWTGIKVVAATIWDGIKTYFTTVLNGYKTLFTTIWNGIKTVVTGVWNALKSGATTIFNAIKTAISNVWNSVKSLSSSVWNGIKSVVTGIWNGLKASASSIFNGVKTLISSVWNGIKSLTTSVWNGIKSTVVNVWNGIKSSTSTVLNGIKSTISNIFGSFKEVVSTAMGKVKSAIETGWNKAKSFLEGINLSSIGRNIIDGLVNGITNAAGAVKTAVQNIANSIPKAMKKLLGIHSPSRVMRDQVGYWISEGLAKGISANTKAEKAAKEKAQAIVKTYKNKLKELDTEYSSGMIDTKKYVNGLNSLKSSYGSISGATVDIQSRISKANTKAAVAEQKKRQEAQRKLAQKFNNEMANVTNKYNADILTDKQYIQRLNNMKKEYGKVTNAISKIDVKIADVRKKQTNEKFKDDKRDYANKSKLANTSMQEELDMLNRLSKHYKKNSDERIYFENLAKQKKQEINEAKKKIDEDYVSKVQKLNEDYVAKYEELTAKYTKAVDDRTNAIKNFAGIFDEVNLSEDVSGAQLLENLRGQTVVLEDWMNNLGLLAQRGLDEGLIAELQEAGPKSAAEIAALTTLSDEQLTQYTELWKKKSELARNQAVSELAGMKQDIINQQIELTRKTESQLKEYKDEWISSMNTVSGKAKNVANQMPGIGANIVQGLIDGINAKKAELEQAMAEVADIITDTTTGKLDIHSPSRVMKKLGNFTTEGFIEGIQQAASKLSNAVNNMYGSLANSAQTMRSSSSTVTSTSNSYDYSKNPSYTVQVTSVSDAQIAKVVRREFEVMAFKG